VRPPLVGAGAWLAIMQQEAVTRPKTPSSRADAVIQHNTTRAQRCEWVYQLARSKDILGSLGSDSDQQ